MPAIVDVGYLIATRVFLRAVQRGNIKGQPTLTANQQTSVDTLLNITNLTAYIDFVSSIMEQAGISTAATVTDSSNLVALLEQLFTYVTTNLPSILADIEEIIAVLGTVS